MGNGMNKILPGLYVGNYRDAKDIKQLENNQITHILAIHDQAKKLHPELEYLCITASDCAGQDLTQYFSECNDFIHKARIEGGNVLVHCLAGVSRSVTVTAAYIMSVTNLNWKHSLNAIRGARHCANPNYGFQKQLQDYNYGKLIKEKKRMREDYPPVACEDKDILEKLLDSHRDWVLNGDTPPGFDGDDFEPQTQEAKQEKKQKETADTKESINPVTKKLNEIKLLSSEKSVSTAKVNITHPKSKTHKKKPKATIFEEKELYDPDDFMIKFIDEESDSANANSDNRQMNSGCAVSIAQNSATSEISGPNVDTLSNVTDKDLDEIFKDN